MSNPMDNEQFRKDQLTKLDNFVKTLYDDAKVISKYSGQSTEDMEILYMHIHDLITEMLQCKTTQEFMDMIQQLHQAIAGVLIVVAPSKSAQVKQEMKEAHTDFEADNFDDFVDKIQETAIRKFGKEGAEKAKEMVDKMDVPEEKKERTQEDTDKLLDALDLREQAKEADEQQEKPTRPVRRKRPEFDEPEDNDDSDDSDKDDPLEKEW